MIRALDVMPLQVLIDATIVEITLTRQLRYGLQWFIKDAAGAVARGVPLADKAAILGDVAGAAGGGFSYAMIANAGNIRVLLNLLASEDLVNVISSPSLMVLNNQQARINVGDQVPLVTGAQAPLIPGVAAFAQFQMQQSGVTVQIRPRVNAGGLVSLEIFQAISDPVGIEAGINQRTFMFRNREIQSMVAVPNGETLALGGLIMDRREEALTGLPYLNRLPLIGWLFGSTTIRPVRTELVVLITPRVVEKKGDIVSISNEFRRKLTTLYPDGRPAPAAPAEPAGP